MIIATPFFDKRKIRKSDNTYPVKVEVNFTPKVRSQIKEAYLTEAEWQLMYNPRLRDPRLLSIKDNIEQEIKRANNIIKELSQYDKLTPQNYKQLMGIKEKKNNHYTNSNIFSHESQPPAQIVADREKEKSDQQIPSLYEIFESIIKIQSKKDSGTATSYQCALNAFRSYKPHPQYSEITPSFFEGFQTFFTNKENSLATVGIYCRSIRTAVKKAFKKKYIEEYPFGLRSEGKYPIPTGKRTKHKALDESSIKNLINFSSDIEEENYAVDILLFSFLCNGINPRDIFHLKACNQNHVENDIEFVRRKTERMTKETVVIEVPLIPKVIAILKKWGTKNPRPNEYVFPLLNNLYKQIYDPNESSFDRKIRFKDKAYRAISNEIRRLNRILLKVEKKIKSPIHLTTGVARYSFANFMERKGAPIKYIQESLGHTNPSTTLRYLDSLKQEEKKEFTQYLEAL